MQIKISEKHWSLQTRLAGNYLILSCFLFSLWYFLVDRLNLVEMLGVSPSQERLFKWELWSLTFLVIGVLALVCQNTWKPSEGRRANISLFIASSLVFSAYGCYMIYNVPSLESFPFVFCNTLIAGHVTLARGYLVVVQNMRDV